MIYASGRINGQDWKKALLVGETEDRIRRDLDYEFLSKLFKQLEEEYWKYSKPTTALEFAFMQENTKNKTIGDGWITEKAYFALKARVHELEEEKKKSDTTKNDVKR